MKRIISDKKGQALVEILIGLGISAAIITGISALVAVNLRSASDSKSIQGATALAQELSDKIKSISEKNWLDIYSPPNGKGLSHKYYISSTTAQLIEGIEPVILENNFSRYFYIENVNRQNCGLGDITANSTTTCVGGPGTGGVSEDPSTQKITVIILLNGNELINQSQYVARSRNLIFRQSDWSGGDGQINFSTTTSDTVINNKFFDAFNIDATSTPGKIKLMLP